MRMLRLAAIRPSNAATEDGSIACNEGDWSLWWAPLRRGTTPCVRRRVASRPRHPATSNSMLGCEASRAKACRVSSSRVLMSGAAPHALAGSPKGQRMRCARRSSGASPGKTGPYPRSYPRQPLTRLPASQWTISQLIKRASSDARNKPKAQYPQPSRPTSTAVGRRCAHVALTSDAVAKPASPSGPGAIAFTRMPSAARR